MSFEGISFPLAKKFAYCSSPPIQHNLLSLCHFYGFRLILELAY